MVELVIKENGKPDFIVGSFISEALCDAWIVKAKLSAEQVPIKSFPVIPDMAAAEAQRLAHFNKIKSLKDGLKSFKKGDFASLSDVEDAFAKLLEVIGVK